VTTDASGPINRLITQAARHLTGLALDVTIAPTLQAARRARLGLVKVGATDLGIGGLGLARVEIKAADVGFQLGRRVRLVTGTVDISARIVQSDLDGWSRRLGLPARLVMRPGRLVARLGVAGIRLGQIEMGVTASGGGIRLSPQRISGFGIDLRTQDELDIQIPIPVLPVKVSITRTEWDHGEGIIELHAPDVAILVTVEDLRRLRASLSRRSAVRVDGRKRSTPDLPSRELPRPSLPRALR
jgi:hypothetical protein